MRLFVLESMCDPPTYPRRTVFDGVWSRCAPLLNRPRTAIGTMRGRACAPRCGPPRRPSVRGGVHDQQPQQQDDSSDSCSRSSLVGTPRRRARRGFPGWWRCKCHSRSVRRASCAGTPVHGCRRAWQQRLLRSEDRLRHSLDHSPKPRVSSSGCPVLAAGDDGARTARSTSSSTLGSPRRRGIRCNSRDGELIASTMNSNALRLAPRSS